jgi:hypothetical protein
MSDVVEPRTEANYFGSCLECRRNDGYLNFHTDHWFVCDEHKLRWWGGSNLFSSWRDETEEDWQANGELLMGYREVEPS